MQVGEKLPENVILYENTPENRISIGELTKGKKVVMCGVPGAFIPDYSDVRTA